MRFSARIRAFKRPRRANHLQGKGTDVKAHRQTTCYCGGGSLCRHEPDQVEKIIQADIWQQHFNYYQDYRMREAARMLKEEKFSVTEIGYKLGYTNLSHFSRVFKQHIGSKPKQFK